MNVCCCRSVILHPGCIGSVSTFTQRHCKHSLASYQAWINQLKAKKQQRQLGMLHDKMRLQKDFLPPGLTFEQFWARMKHYSRNSRVLEYLYGQQNQMDHIKLIKHECLEQVIPPAVYHKLLEVTDNFAKLCLPNRQKVILLSTSELALKFGRVITNQHKKALNQLTKLLNQYHPANDDIHGVTFQNVGPPEHRRQNCRQTRDCV